MAKPKKQQSYKKQAKSSGLNPTVLAIGAVVILAVIAGIVFLLNNPAAAGLPSEISVTTAYAKYGQEDVIFLDVREQEEWDEFHAPQAILIPLGELAARANELPKDKEIVVVCRSGNRSQVGRDTLKAAGFTNVTSMAGGMNEWRTAGYPIAP
jgi:rhodanese-related sulfurtransferase